ncbi:GNAT family N-acetyltransferase [Clostridium taeniosporum]|uniref:N-acetyltransferase n=1 Tax=Clostridium taeniosporum TaxID=394958 RepID=A0A1D7XPH8_9CLOT|nr:GNAT family N-acetyltransferase [Clostridium taeniosporum]AOR25110.1 N-acetyltransferase [Clostridium taeniosporum]
MIITVSEKNIQEAAKIHSISWKDSHIDFCSKDFIEKHNTENQIMYIRNEIKLGKIMYILIENYPVGIVSVHDNVIENLYVLPNEQGNGYGTKLLLFAISKCKNEPILWILNNNKRAYKLYSKYGFKKTGNINILSESISEIEMKKSQS